MQTTLTPELKEIIIKEYEAGHGADWIASKINKSQGFVYTTIVKSGIPTRKAGAYRSYSINSHYFDEIDTHEKAYWLGFLYADGYNGEKGKQVSICLNVKDTIQLEQFKKVLNCNQPLYRHAHNIKENSVRLTLYNKYISEALAKHGCMQNKTFKIRFPSINENFLPSFMLGYFDGDGSVWTSKNRTPGFNITTNYDFANDYQQKLMEKCQLTKTKLGTKKATKNKPTREKAWCINYTGSSLKKIYDYLYSTDIYSLPRKKEKFDKIVNTRPTEDKLICY